jgi:hypothetical protein
MMKRLLLAVAIAAALPALAGNLGFGRLSQAAGGDLSAAVGGGCYDCVATIGACNGTTCTAQAPTWLSKVGSGATPNNCFSVAAGNAGISQCTTNTPQNCFTYRTCTDAACTNCGAPSFSNVNTNCVLTGYRCTG